MNKIICIILIACFCAVKGLSEGISTYESTGDDFLCQVKSVDEFIKRFNGEEFTPRADVSQNSRKENLLSLFDNQILSDSLSHPNTEQDILNFIGLIIRDSLTINLTDSDMWAIVPATAQYKNSRISFQLILQSQPYKEGMIRWCIIGVDGLPKTIVSTEEYFCAISPVEHELHFMGLEDIFNHNGTDIMRYRGKDVRIDPLTVLLTLVSTGLIHDVSIPLGGTTFICTEIHGYKFSIMEINRKGTNSGWLITDLKATK